MEGELVREFRRRVSDLGFGRELIGAYDRVRPAADVSNIDASLVDDSIRDAARSDGEPNGRVLVPVIQGRQANNCYRYCVLAHAFRSRGYRPVIPLCYKCLPLCHEKSVALDDDVVCDMCNYQARRAMEAFGFDTVELADLVDTSTHARELDEPIGASHVYDGVDVSAYAVASTRNHLSKYHLDSADGDDRAVYNRFLRAGRLLVDAGNRLLDTNSFDAAVAHDVNYVYGGILLELASRRDVPAYSVAWGYNEQSIVFGRADNRMATAEFTREEYVEQKLETPLTGEQRQVLQDTLSDRMTGEGRNFEFSQGPGLSTDVSSGTTTAMFTNLIWDDSLAFDSEDYLEYFEWVDETLAYYLEHPDEELVVRTHPAEAAIGTNERVGDYIRDSLGDVPDNVRVIDPESAIDTYELIRDVDAGIVYNTTVGIEMAYLETPVIVTGLTHYRDFGFTYDVRSLDHYEQLLAEAGTLSMSSDMVARARRYAYLLFVAKQVDFPYVSFSESDESGYAYDLHPVSHDDVRPGTEPFDTIVETILADDPVAIYE